MNTLYNHVSTLYSLWTSLDADTDTINKKLEVVIQELENLINREKKEKLLLSANIEDRMTNIECSTHLLGVSLESMLYSSIDNIVISPEMISIYNDLNPTFKKEAALMLLDDKLAQEIMVRESHMKNWLMSIEKLCKSLNKPYRFKPLQDYINNDLSWATIQSVSCELRDLTELETVRKKELNQLLKSIHFYWHILKYSQKDAIDTLLFTLFENFPLNFTLEDEHVHFDYDYIQHPTNQFDLSQDCLDSLNGKLSALKELYKSRHKFYKNSTRKLKAIWEEFNIPILERPSLPSFLGDQDIDLLEHLVNNIDPMIKKVYEEYIQNCKADLTPLWDACLLSELERNEFVTGLYELNTKLEIKQKVDSHSVYLTSIHIEGQSLQALMKERKDLIQKMIDFEKTASDPKRLFQASFQLLEEERWRNSCLPRLLSLDHQLIKAIDEFEKLAGKPVMIGNRRYMDTLLDEIADREANQTFFGFLNSDPIHASTSPKRLKSRPASVGSLGSLQPRKLLKSRASSASNSPTNTTSIEKIKPSQSMPLNKHQQLSRKSSSSNQRKQKPQEISAYINSNINLTKAFKQKKPQMSSLIPSKPITTTKSV